MGIIYLLRRAVELFIDENKVSALTLSKKLDLRYQVASIILDELELIGIISPFDDGGHVL
jgi:ribosomal protein S25